MKVLALFLGLTAAAISLGLLAVAQLIWAQSETSYYVQLALAALLLIGLFIIARRKSTTRALSLAILGTAFVAAIMPIDTTLFAYGLIASQNAAQPPEDGDLISGVGSLTDQLTGHAALWLLYAILLAVFAFGVRHWSFRMRTASNNS